MGNPARRALIRTIMLASLFGGVTGEEMPDVVGHPPRPKGYGVHLSKAERRGKSPAELQALRAQRMSDA